MAANAMQPASGSTWSRCHPYVIGAGFMFANTSQNETNHMEQSLLEDQDLITWCLPTLSPLFTSGQSTSMSKSSQVNWFHEVPVNAMASSRVWGLLSPCRDDGRHMFSCFSCLGSRTWGCGLSCPKMLPWFCDDPLLSVQNLPLSGGDHKP